jgi:hypothetical protein
MKKKESEYEGGRRIFGSSDIKTERILGAPAL